MQNKNAIGLNYILQMSAARFFQEFLSVTTKHAKDIYRIKSR